MKNVYKYLVFIYENQLLIVLKSIRGQSVFFFLIISRVFENIGSHGTEDQDAEMYEFHQIFEGKNGFVYNNENI